MTCLDENAIALLLDGALPEEAREAVEAHLDTCAACRHVIGAAAPPEEAADLGRGAALGRYVVLSLLGRGGMGKVYLSYDPELDRRVAIKVIHPSLGNRDARRLLAREARALGKLSHPNVVQLYDAGEQGGDVFVAMELVEGSPLGAWCRSEPRPGSREVLAAYIDAARGLAAAHEKGIVHRDVKPSNILRGSDGRVRVADFGLAAALESDPASERAPTPRAASAMDAQLTATGALLGTPLYMAPEQHEGAPATASSDQYSLCLALHEGLYGALPFPLSSSARLLEAKKAGPPASPPAGSEVPAWIHAALVRGLAPAPADRYPTMKALIEALGDDRDQRRRALLRRAALGAGAAALIAVAAGSLAASGALRDPCAHPEQQLAGAWDAALRDRVRASLLGTGRPHAEGSATRVIARLDGYAAGWAAMREEVCLASRGGLAPREGPAARDACLDRRRGQLQALTTLLAAGPDPAVLDRAVEMAAGLTPLASCADTEALLARVRPPEDPALRARVTALEPRVDRLRALFAAGKFTEGLALGGPLLEESAGLPYAPLRAQIQYTMGELRDGAGDYEGARKLYREAAISAAEGKDDLLALDAWSRLLFVAADRQRRFDEADILRALGPAAAARVQDASTLARWWDVEGVALSRMGKNADARLAHERALGLREQALGPDHPDTATSLNNLGTVQCAMDDCWGAKASMERALSISEKALGPDHPDTARSLSNLGNTLRRVGDYPRAEAAHRRALAIKEAILGRDHPSVASSLTNLGNVLFDTGSNAEAVALYTRALAIKERALPPDHPDLESTLLGLGRAQVRVGRLDEAGALLWRTLGAREKRLGPAHPDLVGPLVGLGELGLSRGAPAGAAAQLERALSLGNAAWTQEIQLLLAEATWQRGDDPARARALAEAARDGYARTHHQAGAERASRWLDARVGGAL